ncbi:MAG: hypothetical protein JNM99_10075 [Verrucomicrobiaceae bacterium]|nr:hypothetical protein [Verrucomicrobiaceae bacterium]
MTTEDNNTLLELSFKAQLIYRNLCAMEVANLVPSKRGFTALELARRTDNRDAVSWLFRKSLDELREANLITWVNATHWDDEEAEFITID